MASHLEVRVIMSRRRSASAKFDHGFSLVFVKVSESKVIKTKAFREVCNGQKYDETHNT